jgi:hypothetical protein
MLAAIEFDYEPALSTAEVGDEIPHRELTPKSKAIQPPRPKPLP